MADLRTRLTQAVAFARRHARQVSFEAGVNFLGPFLIYSLAKPHLGEVGAIMASSAPPIAWSLIEFARHRRVDAISVLVLGGIALSLVAFIGGGGPKFLLLRERLVTGVIGLVFLGSAAIGRPLIYQLARATMLRRSNTEEAASLQALQGNVYFKRAMTVMTVVWGCGLVADCAICSALVFLVETKTYYLAAPVIGYAFSGTLGLWTFLYVRRQRRLGAERRAAAEAAAAATAPPGPAEPQSAIA